MIILCTVDITTREVTIPSDQRIASYDHKVDVIRFQVETIPGFSLNTSTIRIAAQGPNKVRHDYAVDPSTVAIEEETGYITFDWPIPAGVTEMPLDVFKYGDKGNLIFAVCAEIISGDTVSKAWHSDDGIITVVAHLEPESGGGEDPEEEATNAQKIGQIQTDVAVIRTAVGALANGTPPTASSTSEMDPDESAVYINTTDGKWYYYDGSAWQIGGVYGGAVTSTTFNQHGVPADDFAVGEALAEKADADDVTALDDRVTALEAGGSGSGLTDAQKRAILNCFAHVAWTDALGQTYYDELEDVLFPPAELTRISAVYVNSGVVYPDANIEDLRQYITVTAHFSDSTTTTVNAYTLSGTLTVGTSVITIAYEGKTTTVSVTVTEKPVSDMTHWTDGIKYTNIDVVENSYYSNQGAIAAYNGWSRTGYIPIDGASTIVFDPIAISRGLDRNYNWFFDANKTPISGFSTDATATTVTVPENAHYFGISGETTKVTAVMNAGFTPYA